MQSNSPSYALPGVSGRRRRRSHTRPRRIRRFSAAHVVWSGILRILQRVVHHKKSDRREFKIAFSVRDLLAEKSKVVKAQLEALIQAVQKAGKYPAREEAARAVHAVMEAMREKVPPDVLSRVADSLQLKEVARRSREVAQRLYGEGGKNGTEVVTAASADTGGTEETSKSTNAEDAK